MRVSGGISGGNCVAASEGFDFALTGESISRDEVTARRKRIEHERHELMKIRWTLAGFIAFAIVILVSIFPWPKNLFVGLYGPVFYAGFRLINERIGDLDQQLLDLEIERKSFSMREN